MKCLLVMTFIFINGLENAELKSRHSGTILREDDMEAKAKAWLLMVESGKVDEDHTRKITPKSIFIAPILENRTSNCEEGYAPDHNGECTKIIMKDPNSQLDLLLKRLSAIYANSKEQQQELPHISSGPLQFSLPISNADTVGMDGNNPSAEVNSTTMEVPIELTNQTIDNGRNETDTIENSGSGPLDEILGSSGWEGSGLNSDDSCCNDTTESATLISDELDSTEAGEFTTEITTTDVPYTTDIYESDKYDSDFTTTTELVRDYHVTNRKIVKQERPDNTRIVFPDSIETASVQRQTSPYHSVPNHHSWAPVGTLRPNNHYAVRQLPTQKYWWLPPNWRADEEQRKPVVFKVWSHLPLVQDPSFAGERQDSLRTSLYSETVRPSTRIPEGFTIELQQPLAGTYRRGRVFGARRINTNIIQPRSLRVR